MTNEDPDNWWTPLSVYQERCKYYNVYPELDVCADKYNTKCPYFISKAENALKVDWRLRTHGQIMDIWFNAPGKYIQSFTDKACEQWQKHNMNIIGLVPINTIANGGFLKYWNLFLDKKIRIDPLFGIRPRFLDGRVNQEQPLEPKFGSRNGYMSLLFPKV